MRTLVLGSSLRGLGDVARTCIADGGEVLLFDSEHRQPPEGIDTVVLGPEWDSSYLDGVDRVVTSPWFSDRRPPLADAIDREIPIITEASFGLDRLDIPVVAVTGTNGKTTVTETTTEMLVASGVRAMSAGNIGTPLSALAHGDADCLVLELSSYQLRFFNRLDARAAAILNIAPDHLDWHGSMDRYAEAKARIFDDLGPDGLVVYNADDARVSAIAETAPGKPVPCSATRVPPGGNGVDGETLVVNGTAFTCAVSDDTYRFDLVVAATLAVVLGATEEGIQAVLDSFEPGLHRREHVGSIDGVDFVNDSKATNPHAAVAAAGSYPSVVLLAGGRNKGLDLRPLIEIESVRQLVPFGESGPEIAALAGMPGADVPSLSDAFERSLDLMRTGDTVLLAPGCASFDEFTSYEARGDAFRTMVLDFLGRAA